MMKSNRVLKRKVKEKQLRLEDLFDLFLGLPPPQSPKINIIVTLILICSLLP